MISFDSLDVAYYIVTIIEYACFTAFVALAAWSVYVYCHDTARQEAARVRDVRVTHPSTTVTVLRPRRAYDWADDEVGA